MRWEEVILIFFSFSFSPVSFNLCVYLSLDKICMFKKKGPCYQINHIQKLLQGSSICPRGCPTSPATAPTARPRLSSARTWTPTVSTGALQHPPARAFTLLALLHRRGFSSRVFFKRSIFISSFWAVPFGSSASRSVWELWVTRAPPAFPLWVRDQHIPGHRTLQPVSSWPWQGQVPRQAPKTLLTWVFILILAKLICKKSHNPWRFPFRDFIWS